MVAVKSRQAFRRGAVLGFLILTGFFLAWSPASLRTPWFTPEATNFYHELTDSLLSGQRYLARVPDPGLTALPDPYDPSANAAHRVDDLSYYRGRYTLYHGIAPVLLVFAPVRLLTGNHISATGITWFFGVIGVTASVALLFRLRTLFFAECSRRLVACAVGVLVFAQGYAGVFRGTSLNQVPIAAAYAFAMLALLALLQATRSASSSGRWYALASLCLGLTVASRPNYVFGCVAICVAACLWQRRATPAASWGRAALASLLPCVAIGLGIMLWNALRFGNPFELGAHYMLGAWDQRHLPWLSGKNLEANFHDYFLAPGIYSAKFPYVVASSWQSIGLLLNMPVVWFALLLPAATIATPPPLKKFLAALALLAVTNTLSLLLLPSGNPTVELTSANLRYLLDFQPLLILIAAIAMLGTGQRVASRPALRRTMIGTAALLSLVSIAASVSIDLSRFPLESYRGVARFLSAPAWWWERLHGAKYGPARFEVIFPTGKTGAREPLLTTGKAEAGDLVYVFYDSPATIRFGLVGSGAPGPLTASIPLDYAHPHQIELHLGSLNPAITHPSLAKVDDAQVAALKRRFAVRLDGTEVFSAPAFFHEASPDSVVIGRALFLRDYCAAEFTGRISHLARGPIAATVSSNAPKYGPVRLRLRFPSKPENGSEPLVASGVSQAGDVLMVSYRSDGFVRFAFDHWGYHGIASEWMPVDFSRDHDLEISHGGLLPPLETALWNGRSISLRRKMKERLVVTFDGQRVFDLKQPAYDSSPYDVYVGHNVAGFSSCTYAFSGKILTQERLPYATAP